MTKKRDFRQVGVLTRVGLLIVAMVCATEAIAVENGTGIYLLGSRGSYAAYMPSPGLYWQNDLYHYRGKTSKSKRFPSGGKLVANLDSEVWLDLFGVTWMPNDTVLGGTLALGAILPFGNMDVNAGVQLDPVFLNPVNRGVSDDVTTIGDPLLSSTLGWSHGNFYWSTTALVNVPIGDYRVGEIANVSANRWALDWSAALSWISLKTGTEMSVVPGYTFNGENHETDYKSGEEFHLEWSVSQALHPRFSLGVIGYYYEQKSADSGRGAVLGSYKGEVEAIGGTLSMSFGDLSNPLMVRVKAFNESDAVNRIEGDAYYLTLSSAI